MEEKKKKGSDTRHILSKIGIGILTFFMTIILIGTIVAVVFVVRYGDDITALKSEAVDIVRSIDSTTFRSREESRIYDKDGELISTIRERDYEYVEYDDIGKNVINSFIAVEDLRYYEHEGVDYKSIARAGLEYVRNRGEITQGGSTITQQLAKNVFLTHEQTMDRKLTEIFIAIELENIYSKSEILEYYLNNIYFGRGAYGVQTAAQTYFSKDVDELTVSEAALLTALTNNPTLYDPIENPQQSTQKRNTIIGVMREHGFISEGDYREARYSELGINLNTATREEQGLLSVSSYPVTFAVHSAALELMRRDGFEFKYWFDEEFEKREYRERYEEKYNEYKNKINSGGYHIYTTIDMDKQDLLQETVDNSLRRYSTATAESGVYRLQGSAVTIDNRTGDVLAIVGGRSQDDVENFYNRAYQAYRQPGSAIKPILVYTPAFERGLSPRSRMEDSEIRNGPQNYDGRYRGMVTISDAIKHSYNTIPYKLAEMYGPRTLLQYLAEMEFSNLDPKDNVLATSIGGFTYGTNTLEMTSAYSTIARAGMYVRPTGIERIETTLEEVLYENPRREEEVYDFMASETMTRELRRVVEEPGGTAYGIGVRGVPSAGKTGTTDEYRDVWFVGYTPDYTTGVWVGEDNPRPLGSARRGPRDIWRVYMNSLHQDLN